MPLQDAPINYIRAIQDTFHFCVETCVLLSTHAQVDFVRAGGIIEAVHLDRSKYYKGDLVGSPTGTHVIATVNKDGLRATIFARGEIYRVEPFDGRRHRRSLPAAQRDGKGKSLYCAGGHIMCVTLCVCVDSLPRIMSISIYETVCPPCRLFTSNLTHTFSFSLVSILHTHARTHTHRTVMHCLFCK